MYFLDPVIFCFISSTFLIFSDNLRKVIFVKVIMESSENVLLFKSLCKFILISNPLMSLPVLEL